MIPTTIMISSRVKAWSDRFPPARLLAREAFRSRRAEVTAANVKTDGGPKPLLDVSSSSFIRVLCYWPVRSR